MGAKERKQRELSERKDLIISKSKELFFAYGFNNVSVSDICKAVEYGQSAIYNLFSSKEEIYGYVYVEAMSILADLITSVDVEKIDLRFPLQQFTTEVFNFYAQYNQYYTALFFLDFNRVAFSKLPDFLISQKYREKERAMAVVREVLNRGIVSDIIIDLDVDLLINTYFASLLGIINIFIIENNDLDSCILKKNLVNHAMIYEKGICK